MPLKRRWATWRTSSSGRREDWCSSMQANPVIVKELRGRMRGSRAAIILTVYLATISALTLLFYATLRSNDGMGSGAPQIGKMMFYGVVVFQTMMVALLT